VSPQSDVPVDLVHVTLPAGKSVAFPASSYTFVRHYIWLLEGRLDFIEGETTHRLQAGDCLKLGAPVDCIYHAPGPGDAVYLVVVSEFIFDPGQRIARLDEIVARTHLAGGRVLLDVYHALGALPVDVTARDVDFAVGGSYKYLRGGPGACFLYLHPRHLDGSLRTLDIGWFAKRDPFTYRRPDPPELGQGGDAFLESTPAVLAWYQARAGQRLAIALDCARVRAYSLAQQRRLAASLASQGIVARGGTEDHGAFVVVTTPRAGAWRDALARRGIVTDARGGCLRLCPDVLTTDDELECAARALGAIARDTAG
jgi:kynureninase